MKHILPTDTVNKILSYLASKAFSEVSSLITEIQSVAKPFVDPSAPVAPVIAPVAEVTPIIEE